MNAKLDQLASSVSADHPCASAEINGKKVDARAIIQCRATTQRAMQKPSVAWYVNGKRVAKSNLLAAIN